MQGISETTIVRIRKRKSAYVQIDKTSALDPRLSLAAKGLHLWLMCKPDDWKVVLEFICKETSTSLHGVKLAMKELTGYGYVKREPIYSRRTGQILRWVTHVFETPQLAKEAEQEQPSLFETKSSRTVKPRFQQTAPEVENPQGGKPVEWNPVEWNPHATNKRDTEELEPIKETAAA